MRLPLIAATLLLPLLAAPANAEQAADSGKSLAVYCNTVPDLAVQRTDAVDNWVRICTVWLDHRCKASDMPTAPSVEKKN